MIAIIDYGMGNLHSVSKAIERLGYAYTITHEPHEIMAASAAILPGVGAFGDAMAQLRLTGMDEVTRSFAASGRPLLGICLGMQLLFDSSEEHGINEGLGLLPGQVVRFPEGSYKVPHMGWNEIYLTPHHQSHALFEGLEPNPGHVYFVHSYHAKPADTDELFATTDYYGDVTAIVGQGNVLGMQFHPEKSGELGMKLLRNFLKMSER